MKEAFEYIDNLHPVVPLCIFIGMYLIARYASKKHLKNQCEP